MSDSDRRQFLKGVLGTLVQAAGTVVLASTAASSAGAKPEGTETPPEDIQDRADRLASSGDGAAGEAATAANAFLNYRPVPTFGGFLNNAGWPNGVGGLFRNGPWMNGPWVNGPWRNGWPNVGWRNWWG